MWLLIGLGLLSSAVLGVSLCGKIERWTVWLALVGVMVEAEWLVLTIADRMVWSNWPSIYVYGIGTVLFLLIGFWNRKKWRLPEVLIKTWKKEVPVVLVTSLVFLGAIIVLSRNGWVNGGWIAHGYYNGDTATLSALVNGSLMEQGLFDRNPFSYSPGLEYPTLLHGGLATLVLVMGLADNWLIILPWLVLGQVLITIPLLFWGYDRMFAQHLNSRMMLILTGLMAIYVIGTSWDNFVYPQSHFFLTGIFLGLVGLLNRVQSNKDKLTLWQWGLAAVFALVLLLSNAVTGTAALGLICASYGMQALNSQNSKVIRWVYVLGIGLWLVIFLKFTPGEGGIAIVPQFSYTAALDAMKLAPLIIITSLGSALYFRQKPILVGLGVTLVLLGLVSFIFSERELVIANASRFWYHAVLLLWPMTVGVFEKVIKGWVGIWISFKKERIMQLIWLAGGLSIVMIMLMPVGASMATTMDSLLFQDEKRVSREEIQALRWIKDQTAESAIFLQNPDSFWSIPMFTGRTVVRTKDYWLSVNDELLAEIQLAFAGNIESQARVCKQADFILLSQDEYQVWENFLQKQDAVFFNNEVGIWMCPS